MIAIATIGGLFHLLGQARVAVVGKPDARDGSTEGTTGVVAQVIDGDTIRLRDGRRVRLVQIDAPEHDECFGRGAADELRRIAPPGTRLLLVADPALDSHDVYGRFLAYAYTLDRASFLNESLVEAGAAVPYFFRSRRGLFATQLLLGAERARRGRRGLWGSCPRARLDPDRGSLTGPA